MNKKEKDIEILAPVGNMESLYAAVQNGANAIYLGGKLFNARKYASNFDEDELINIVEYAHLRKVKVYVTVNILIGNEEMEEAISYIRFLYNIDVDGLIVQDLGLTYLVKKLFPKFQLHGSTQMTINNLEGALFLEEMDFKRVVLARELSIHEIKNIKENSNIELEGFIHGALCVCYSGQCLMSSIIGGRSGNRGTCAQPCRMPYTIVNLKNGEVAFRQLEKKHILSTKDLNTIEYIEEIVNSGLKSLKIEGRMKRPEYVALVVSKYRKALDEGSNKISEDDKEELLEIFNRGFTKGYILDDFGQKFISLDRPDNRGVHVGKVENIDKKYIYIHLEKDLNIGDGIEFSTSNGKYVGVTLDISAKKGTTLKIDKIIGVSINSMVYKTSNAFLIKKARESFEDGEKIKFPIDMEVFISVGKPPVLIVKNENYTIKVESTEFVEKAQKVSLTKERIENQLNKLGDVPYYIEKLDIHLEENCFLSLSSLNELRREGIRLLNEKRANFNHREKISEDTFSKQVDNIFKFNLKEQKISSKKRMSVKVSNINQFKKIDLNKLDRIYLGFTDGVEDCVKEAKSKGKEVYISTDKILHEKDLKLLEEKIKLISNSIDGVSVSNIGTLNFVKKRFDINIHGDIGLNIFNNFTSLLLQENGVKSVTLSPELNLSQIKQICVKSEIPLETICYGYLPLMVTKHCPMSLVKGCRGVSCSNCEFRKGYGLKDRLGKTFVFDRKMDTTTIYNTVPLMVLEDIESVYDSGVDMTRLDFTFEEEGIDKIQNVFYESIHGLLDVKELKEIQNCYKKESGITKGHYFRGVL